MSLPSGTRLGPYEISAPLGAGGMGDVYRAKDPRLGRDVAIKALRSDIGDRRRFELEARALSSLNHPNIVTIFDIGETGGAPYIVSELLDGETLREILRAGPVPVRKLLDIGVQIAAGLAAAHDRGITHRDLKPENVMVLHDGRAKILDFGLAKSPSAGDVLDDTQTAHGMVVGTLAYMSPEQAQGRELDFRSDQFSLGVILYEMATGQHPFRRSDRVGTLSAITGEEPVTLATHVRAPAPLRWIIERCLAKDPAQRYACTADLQQQLRDVRDHLSEVFSSESLAAIAPPVRRRAWLRRSAAAAFGLGIFALAAFVFLRSPAVSTLRFTPFATEAIDEAEPAWSPDGKSLAYTASINGVAQVFVRSAGSPTPAQVTSVPSNCTFPAWSPDGSRIYFWSMSSLWSVGAAGGVPEQVNRDVVGGRPPASISPDGNTMAYFGSAGSLNSVRIMRMSDRVITSYERSPFPATFRSPGGIRFSPDGRLLLVWLVPEVDRGAELWLLPFPDGEPRRIEAAVLRGYRSMTASWKPDNRHVVVAAELAPGSGTHLHLLDVRNGDVRAITAGAGEEREPSVSPDGARIAFASGGADSDLYEVSMDGARVTPLLATARHEHSADWSSTGRQFVYVSDSDGEPEIWMRNPGERSAMPVVRRSPEGHLAFASPRLSPDGQRVAYLRVGNRHLVWISNLSGGQTAPLESESQDQHLPAWSPDGNWIAYTRFFRGKWEIAKAPSGGGGRPARIADGGGASGKFEWSPSGESICYLTAGELWIIPASGGTPQSLAKGVATLTFNRDGSVVYIVRRTRDRTWQLLTIGVASRKETEPVPLNLPAEANVYGARLHPSGDRLVVSVERWQRDIWILENF